MFKYKIYKVKLHKMPSYTIVKDHVFIGPAFYCKSGTYKWNIVNNETKKLF